MPTPRTKSKPKKKAVAKNQTKTINKVDPELPFMIGSDPEFLMFFGNRGLDASNIINSFFENKSYIQEGSGYVIPNVGNFGWDGASSTAELRPKATKQIGKMLAELRTMLEVIVEKIPTVDLTTLSIGSPIGGHIHVDSFMHRPTEGATAKEVTRVENIMATYLLPLSASDHRVSALTRLKGGNYGKLTDFRYENKGRVVTAEIRGLTAEWLTTPKTAYATFAYIVTVWHELSKRNIELYKDDFITKNKEQNQTLQRMMLSDFKIIEQGITRAIKKKIKTFELYPQFKTAIDWILEPEEVLRHKEKVGWNINTGWQLTAPKKPSKADLLNPNKAINILKKHKIPDINGHFGFMYNDDYNVNLFSTAISERIAALNWQLKNDYFFFGFKKSVEGYGAMSPDNKFYVMPSNQSTQDTINTMEKMQHRSVGSQIARIDPKTGKIRKANNNTKIIIGIPYNDRADKNTKNLVELIYKIENNKLVAKDASTFSPTVTTAKEQTVSLENIVDTTSSRRSNTDPCYEVHDVINQINQL